MAINAQQVESLRIRFHSLLNRNVCLVAACILAFFIWIIVQGCAGPIKRIDPLSEPHSVYDLVEVETIYVVSHGWHTGIILEEAALDDSLIPERQDFPDAKYLEFGWGDEDFYQAPGFSIGLALKAIFWPTNSVLHVVGFSKPVEEYYADQPLVKIDLSAEGFGRLSQLIDSYFAGDETTDKASPLGPGLFRSSKFYAARGKYSLVKTCNVWTARMLRAAGCPIVPVSAVTSSAVMSRCKDFGVVIR